MHSLKCFSWEFLLGVAYNLDQNQASKGGMNTVSAANQEITKKKISHRSKDHFRHLLLQYTTAAATNRELMFYLLDYQMRHSVMTEMHVKIKQNPQAFDDFAGMVDSEEFSEKIKLAVEDPTSKVANEVISRILPVLSFGSRKNLLGSLADNRSLSLMQWQLQNVSVLEPPLLHLHLMMSAIQPAFGTHSRQKATPASQQWRRHLSLRPYGEMIQHTLTKPLQAQSCCPQVTQIE